MNKCKGCEWYGKPYWSIINPCDNCPREDVEIITRWQDPTIKELQERIDKAIEYIRKHSNNCMFELRIEEMEELLNTLEGSDKQ